MKLTEIEMQFVLLACRGLRYKEIAQRLYRTQRCIEGIRDRVLAKTGSTTMNQAVAFLFREGYIQ